MTEHAPHDAGDESIDQSERARLLFRYLNVEEWADYRAIMAVFADTYFSEFGPDDVTSSLAAGPAHVDPAVIPDRLRSLRRWGNLTVSTSVGNPASITDYYRRRDRYLITRDGQRVHGLVEDVLATVDEVAGLESGRLRDLHLSLIALQALVDRGIPTLAPGELADQVRAVFDPHEAFTTEITQFFASLNQWQSRYDLDPSDLRFFAEVLVGYISEQLSVVERQARAIGRIIDRLEPSFPTVAAGMSTGLAARVDAAGLGGQISVRRTAGSHVDDWTHLARWFWSSPAGPSRIDALMSEAMSAVRTLTTNLTRLSGVGIGSASRRVDFVQLAGFFLEAEDQNAAHRLAAAAFGLAPARHVGAELDDADDPVPVTTPWARGPKASVPISVRERGEVTTGGKASPLRDRTQEKELLRRRREQSQALDRRVTAELLGAAAADGSIDGAELSMEALARLRDLIGQSSYGVSAGQARRSATDREVYCEVHRRPGGETVVSCPQGRLRLIDIEVRVTPAPTTVEFVR